MNQLHKIIELYGNIPNQLLGYIPISYQSIDSYEKYCQIYKTRHDLVHAIICDKFEVKFGERTVRDALTESNINVEKLRYFKEIENQTPDYISFNSSNRSCRMFEISVSRSQDTRRYKMSKYALLSHFITKEMIYSLDYQVFIFFPMDILRDRDILNSQGIDDNMLDIINKICKNTEMLLSKVHETSEGQLHFLTYNDVTDEKISLSINRQDVLETIKTHPGVFKNENQINDLINGTNLNKKNIDEFMDGIIDLVDTFEPELLIQPKKFNPDNFLIEMKAKSNSNIIRSVFPLPYFTMSIVDSAIRSTLDDLHVIRRVAAKMISSEDVIMSAIGEACIEYFNKKKVETNDDLLFPCKLDSEVRFLIALEGPGRKKYINNDSAQHIKTQIKYNGYALDPFVDVQDIERVMSLLSSREDLLETGDIFANVDMIVNVKGVGLNYVRTCQSIYREVNINAMRRDRRRNFILKPTGVRGVSVLIHPGPRLRSGEMPNLAWFRVVIERELYIDDPLSNHWAFKKLHRSGQICFSEWLSVDVHRLDHYIRCFDKIIMVYFSYLTLKTRDFGIRELMEKKSKKDKESEDDFISMATDKDSLFDMMKNQSLIGLYNTDKTNTLGLIITIYLEDRRSTSKMLQNMRYLFMTSISLMPQYVSVFDKMSTAIRSPLQSYLLHQALNFYRKMKIWKPKGNCIFGRTIYDKKTQVFNDTHGGSVLMFPRMMIKPDLLCDFHEILCEMYFTMLFNKNQDDPTHASFQVLDKIIEGEESFKESKANGMIYGEGDEDHVTYARKIITKPHLHQFSKVAIEVGSKLLRNDHLDTLSDEIKRACLKKNVNKTIDNFATYKSSSTAEYYSYDPKLLRQNKRTKCINAVMKLLNEGIKDSYDVAEKYKKEETFYQVFKKNQIGGVREILILPITNRIRINILETVSRNICDYDSREILTHGMTKNESIRSLLYKSKRYTNKRSPIHLTFDKSKWGPSFIPIQFMYLFTCFKDQMGPLYFLFMDLLIRHQHKTCLMPDRLVKAWYLDQDNLHKHKYESLQKVKNKFLMDKDLRYKNESNMGQGILHFTSSYLHLCLISFRNELYKRVCKKNGWADDDHEDLLSSDDSYTLFSPEIIEKSTSKFIRHKLRIFLSCQEISERLFNCRTSLNKSSINPFIGEFNSLFISNMTFIPTLIKFALASVHPVNTDSFYRMVKESYSSSRQIVENGGTMDLYLLSHKLNKIYCESIYHTSEGGFNDKQSLDLSVIPYQMGEYPIFNPALMLIFGPEYFNYKIYKRQWEKLSPLEQKFYKNSHKVMHGNVMDTMSEFEDTDTLLGGLLRIEASIGPVTQLENFKRQAVLQIPELRKMILDDPLIILKQPKTLEEVKFKACQKLYTNGSKEAVKVLAASIFYGRVSASVSAKVFYIPGTDFKDTYKNCLKKILEEPEIKDFDKHFKFLYPNSNEYDLFLDKENFVFDYKKRHPLEVQTIQKMTTHKIRSRLVNSVPDLLEYHWGIKPIPIGDENKVQRDIEIINIHYGIIKKSLELTCDQFSGDKEEKIKKLLMLILKLYRLRDRSFKGVVYGVSSDDITRTYLNLLERNATQGFSTRLQKNQYPVKNLAQSYEEMFAMHNYDVLRILNNMNPKAFKTVDRDIIDNFLSDPSISRNQKKRIFMLSVAFDTHIIDMESWSEKTSVIIHYWKQKQIFYENKYQGDFELCLFMGHRRLLLNYKASSDSYSFYYKMEDDPELLFTFITEAAEILQMDIDQIIKKTEMGNYIIKDQKVLKVENLGFKLTELKINFSIPYKSCQLSIEENRVSLLNWDSFKKTKILNIDLGLFPSSFKPNIEDFNCYGVSFLKLCEIGAFSHNFNLVSVHKNKILECLDDLKILEPQISPLTKPKFPELDLMEGKIENKTILDLELLDKDAIIIGFANVSEEDLKDIEVTYDDDMRMDDFISYINTTDLINTLNVSTKIVHTRKILNIIRNIKYEMITYMFSSQMRLSSRIIKTIWKVLKGNDETSVISVVKSLIAIYDRQENTPGSITPEDIDFSIFKPFMQKFNLSD